jgi:hypothetical protein
MEIINKNKKYLMFDTNIFALKIDFFEIIHLFIN